MKKKLIKNIFAFSLIFTVIDQISKILFNRYLVLGKSYTIFEKFFYVTKTYNDGVSFSMLSGHKNLIILIALLIMVFLFLYMQKFKESKKNILAFSLVYGGLFGNLIDRVIYGYVIDFLDFYIFGYNYPVFNLADTFIFIGVCILIYAVYLGEDNDNSSK